MVMNYVIYLGIYLYKIYIEREFSVIELNIFFYRCNYDTNDLYKNIAEDSISMKTIKNMAKLWTNFAKFG